jgi:hypothetical protein
MAPQRDGAAAAAAAAAARQIGGHARQQEKVGRKQQVLLARRRRQVARVIVAAAAAAAAPPPPRATRASYTRRVRTTDLCQFLSQATSAGHQAGGVGVRVYNLCGFSGAAPPAARSALTAAASAVRTAGTASLNTLA